MSNVVIDGVAYEPVVKRTGNRAVVVVDRGWVWAGDVTEHENKIVLSNVVWLFHWESIGFDGVLANPKSEKVMLKKIENNVEIPNGSIIFRVPVADDWGL
jgi:hypothetical protein